MDPTGHGLGVMPSGKTVRVRGAPPGARIEVQIIGKERGAMLGRRLSTVRAPVGAVPPACDVFGLCGGCVLQELSLDAQRAAKHAQAVADVATTGPIPVVHPMRGAPDGYGYRNRVELSFGSRRFLDDAAHASGASIDGKFLGFHAPGRFDRVVDALSCPLIDDDANTLLTVVRAHALAEDAPPVWDARAHTGFWRHLLLRRGESTGEHLIVLFTADQREQEPAVTALAEALMATPLRSGRLVGVEWAVNDSVADVARGETARTWGRPTLEERLGPIQLQLSRTSFFQTSTTGARILYDTVGEALGAGGTLLDLYCGAGSIGLYLGAGFDRVVGVEEIADAVTDARANAERHGIAGEWHHARVEDALDLVAAVPGPRRLVVDPPRVGLHPRAAAAIAGWPADVLVYVACRPSSLGRDRAILEAGGWRLTDLWVVDLFPQTAHVEAVARFVKDPV